MELRRRGGTASSVLIAKHARIPVHAILRRVLCHKIRRFLRAEDLSQVDKPAKLLLLQPYDATVQVTHAADTLVLKNAERNSGVHVKPYSAKAMPPNASQAALITAINSGSAELCAIVPLVLL